MGTHHTRVFETINLQGEIFPKEHETLEQKQACCLNLEGVRQKELWGEGNTKCKLKNMIFLPLFIQVMDAKFTDWDTIKEY